MGAPQLVAMVAVDLINRQGNVSRAIAPTILAALALIATVAVLSDDSSAAFESSDQNLAIRSNQKVAESSQLQNFDLAIQRVDQGIRASSTQLVGHSQKIIEANKMAQLERQKLITQQRIAQQERNTLIKEQGIAAAANEVGASAKGCFERKGPQSCHEDYSVQACTKAEDNHAGAS